MWRVRIDPSSTWGRWFRPAAAILIVILAALLVFREARSPDRDLFTIVALLAAVAVGLFALLHTSK